MRLRVSELNGSYTAKVVEVSAYLVIRGARWELRLCDEEVGLRDVGCADVVSEEENGDGGLGVGVFAEDGGAKCCEKLGSDGDDE